MTLPIEDTTADTGMLLVVDRDTLEEECEREVGGIDEDAGNADVSDTTEDGAYDEGGGCQYVVGVCQYVVGVCQYVVVCQSVGCHAGVVCQSVG